MTWMRPHEWDTLGVWWAGVRDASVLARMRHTVCSYVVSGLGTGCVERRVVDEVR